MATSLTPSSGSDEIGHVHADVGGGWLRAATFGAMDGLVTNISLVAGVGASGASNHVVVLTGTAGLVAGAFSMALGEYTSVQTQNEQIDREWDKEMAEIRDNPAGEQAELAEMLEDMGMRPETAAQAAAEIHRDEETATLLHLTQELGLDPTDQPSPYVAAGSSFVMFGIGAVIPLLPYLLGFGALLWGLLFGAVGLLLAGGIAALFTTRPWWLSALRQLAFGALAAGATYIVGSLIGVGVA